MFSKELRCLMYGFGDDQNPYTESVELLEDLVIEFITDMVSLIFGLVFIQSEATLTYTPYSVCR